MQTITYDTKSYINENPTVPATNKIQAVDMNEIKTVVNNNANETHTWTYLSSATGSSVINLPASFKELLCIVQVAGNTNILYTFNIPVGALSSTNKGFNDGYYEGSTINSHVRVILTTTTASLSVAKLNNADSLSSSTLEVYYR